MARLLDLKLAYQLFVKAYPCRRFDWKPGAQLAKPLNKASITIVTTAAFYAPDQLAFDTSIRGGDCSSRVISLDTDLSTLAIAHGSDAFDTRGIEADRNLALPLDRFKSLAAAGIIGAVAP